MRIVSVATLLLGCIFAYSYGAPQFGNFNALANALAQLAQQLARQSNSTLQLGNNSVIVSGVSSAIANANAFPNNNFLNYGLYPGLNSGLSPDYGGFNQGWYPGWGSWNGFWRSVSNEDPPKEGEEIDQKSEDGDYQKDIEDEESKDQKDLK